MYAKTIIIFRRTIALILANTFLVSNLVLADSIAEYSPASSATLAPTLATKPIEDDYPVKIVWEATYDGTYTYDAITNHAAITKYRRDLVKSVVERKETRGSFFRNDWALVDMSYLIGQMLVITRDHRLQNPKDLFIPLIKKHFKNRDAMDQLRHEGYDIDGIQTVWENDKVAAFTIPKREPDGIVWLWKYYIAGPGDNEGIAGLTLSGGVRIRWDVEAGNATDSHNDFGKRQALGLSDKARMLDHIVGDRIIELGCGEGGIEGLVKERKPGARIVGIDFEEKFLRKAKADFPDCEFYRRDFSAWTDLGDFRGKFSTVILSSALHEVEGKDLSEQVLKTAYELLEPGGVLIFRDGIKPDNKNEEAEVVFKTSYAKIKFERFVKEYRNRQIKFSYTNATCDHIRILRYDLQDLLCKYYFEGDLWERDMDESFGHMNMREYHELIGKYFTVTHHEEYIAPYLLELWKRDFQVVDQDYPYSHTLIIAQKGHAANTMGQPDFTASQMPAPDSEGQAASSSQPVEQRTYDVDNGVQTAEETIAGEDAKALIVKLKDANPYTVRDAARRLGVARCAEAVVPILEILKNDRTIMARNDFYVALVRIGAPGVERIIECLYFSGRNGYNPHGRAKDDNVADLHDHLAAVLTKIDHWRAQLYARLDMGTRYPGRRRIVVRALANQVRCGKVDLDEIVQALHSNTYVSISAAHVLAELKCVDKIPDILAVIDDWNTPSVKRRELIDALGIIGDPSIFEPLYKRLAMRDWESVAEAAAKALGKLKHPKAQFLFALYKGDIDRIVREGESAIPALIDAMACGYHVICNSAATAIERIGAPAIGPLEEAIASGRFLKDPNGRYPNIYAWADAILSRMKYPSGPGREKTPPTCAPRQSRTEEGVPDSIHDGDIDRLLQTAAIVDCADDDSALRVGSARKRLLAIGPKIEGYLLRLLEGYISSGIFSEKWPERFGSNEQEMARIVMSVLSSTGGPRSVDAFLALLHLRTGIDDIDRMAAWSFIRNGEYAAPILSKEKERLPLLVRILNTIFSGAPRPNIDINITHRCPLRCKPCAASLVMDTSPDARIPFKQIERMAAMLRGWPSIVLAGGEPFAYRDATEPGTPKTLIDVLKVFHTHEIGRVYVDTNGFYLPTEQGDLDHLLDQVPDNVTLIISVDERHLKEMRQKEKDLAAIVVGVENYIERKQRLEVEYNFRAYSKYFAENSELEHFFARILNVPLSKLHRKPRIYQNHLIGQPGTVNYSHDDPAHILSLRPDDIESHSRPGDLQMSMAPDGNIYTCNHAFYMPDPPQNTYMGNIFSEDFYYILTRWALGQVIEYDHMKDARIFLEALIATKRADSSIVNADGENPEPSSGRAIRLPIASRPSAEDKCENALAEAKPEPLSYKGDGSIFSTMRTGKKTEPSPLIPGQAISAPEMPERERSERIAIALRSLTHTGSIATEVLSPLAGAILLLDNGDMPKDTLTIHSKLIAADTELKHLLSQADTVRKNKLPIKEYDSLLKPFKAQAELILKYDVELQKAISANKENIKKGSSIEEDLDLTAEALHRVRLILESRLQFIDAGSDLSSIDIVAMIKDAQKCTKYRQNEIIAPGMVTFGKAGEIPVMGDRINILNTISNLVNNAYQAHPSPDKAKINIHVDRDDTSAIIKISDDSGGIRPDLLEIGPNGRPKLFDLDVTTKDEGTGLGTTEAWYAVKNMGGTIEVESELGKGTTFVIRLPIASRPSAEDKYKGDGSIFSTMRTGKKTEPSPLTHSDEQIEKLTSYLYPALERMQDQSLVFSSSDVFEAPPIENVRALFKKMLAVMPYETAEKLYSRLYDDISVTLRQTNENHEDWYLQHRQYDAVREYYNFLVMIAENQGNAVKAAPYFSADVWRYIIYDMDRGRPFNTDELSSIQRIGKMYAAGDRMGRLLTIITGETGINFFTISANNRFVRVCRALAPLMDIDNPLFENVITALEKMRPEDRKAFAVLFMTEPEEFSKLFIDWEGVRFNRELFAPGADFEKQGVNDLIDFRIKGMPGHPTMRQLAYFKAALDISGSPMTSERLTSQMDARDPDGNAKFIARYREFRGIYEKMQSGLVPEIKENVPDEAAPETDLAIAMRAVKDEDIPAKANRKTIDALIKDKRLDVVLKVLHDAAMKDINLFRRLLSTLTDSWRHFDDVKNVFKALDEIISDQGDQFPPGSVAEFKFRYGFALSEWTGDKDRGREMILEAASMSIHPVEADVQLEKLQFEDERNKLEYRDISLQDFIKICKDTANRLSDIFNRIQDKTIRADILKLLEDVIGAMANACSKMLDDQSFSKKPLDWAEFKLVESVILKFSHAFPDDARFVYDLFELYRTAACHDESYRPIFERTRSAWVNMPSAKEDMFYFDTIFNISRDCRESGRYDDAFAVIERLMALFERDDKFRHDRGHNIDEVSKYISDLSSFISMKSFGSGPIDEDAEKLLNERFDRMWERMEAIIKAIRGNVTGPIGQVAQSHQAYNKGDGSIFSTMRTGKKTEPSPLTPGKNAAKTKGDMAIDDGSALPHEQNAVPNLSPERTHAPNHPVEADTTAVDSGRAKQLPTGYLTDNRFVESLLLEEYLHATDAEFQTYQKASIDATRSFLTRDHPLKHVIFSQIDSLSENEVLRLADRYLATAPSWNDGIIGFYDYSTYDISEGALPLRLTYLQGVINPANASEILFDKNFNFFASGDQLNKLASKLPKNAEGIVECYYTMYRGTAIIAKQFEDGELVLIEKQDINSICRILDEQMQEIGGLNSPQKAARTIIWRLLCIARLCSPLDKPNKIETLNNIQEVIDRLTEKYPAIEGIRDHLLTIETDNAHLESEELAFVQKAHKTVSADVLNYLHQREAFLNIKGDGSIFSTMRTGKKTEPSPLTPGKNAAKTKGDMAIDDGSTLPHEQNGVPNLSPERTHAQNFHTAIDYIQAKRDEAVTKKPAKDESLPDIIAVGKSWIKGYKEGECLQFNALNPLIIAIKNYCEKRNIPFIISDDDDLPGLIDAAKTEMGLAPDAKVVVLAGADKDGITSSAIKPLVDNESYAIVGVNGEELTEDSYMRIVEMLTIALKISMGLDEDLASDCMTILPPAKNRPYYIIVPHAKRMDYEDLRIVYNVQRDA